MFEKSNQVQWTFFLYKLTDILTNIFAEEMFKVKLDELVHVVTIEFERKLMKMLDLEITKKSWKFYGRV